MVPRLLEETGRPEVLAARLLLRLAKHVRLADLHRHVLPVGVLLHVRGKREALDDVGADHDDAVRLEQDGRTAAEVFDELL